MFGALILNVLSQRLMRGTDLIGHLCTLLHGMVILRLHTGFGEEEDQNTHWTNGVNKQRLHIKLRRKLHTGSTRSEMEETRIPILYFLDLLARMKKIDESNLLCIE